jgi:hypothetical protein
VQLQGFLINSAFLAAGNDTGFFGKLTQAAVQGFQRSKALVSSGTPATTGYGVVGPKTRAALLACNATAVGTGGDVRSHPKTYDDLQAELDALKAQLASRSEGSSQASEISSLQSQIDELQRKLQPAPDLSPRILVEPIPIQPITNSTPGIFRVRDYGAKCDATGDDTAAIQAAEDAREAAGGGTLSFPLGFCNIAGTIFIRKGGTIEGAGHSQIGSEVTASVLRSTSPSADVFLVVTPDAVTFRNLKIDSGSTVKSQGSGILVQPSAPPHGSLLNHGSRFDNIAINQHANGIALYNVADFNITGALIVDYHNNGIYVNNGAAVDAGHSLISGSTIWDLNVQTGAASVRLDPAANVNLVGNKLLGGLRGVWLTVSAGPTGTFTMSNNSLEEQHVSSIYIEQSVPGKKYANVIINSNQFGNSVPGVQSVITIAQGYDPYLSGVTIANNITLSAIDRDAQFVINDGNGVSITGNVLDNLGHDGAWGIMTGGNATNVSISGNVFSRFPKGNYGPLTSGTIVH